MSTTCSTSIECIWQIGGAYFAEQWIGSVLKEVEKLHRDNNSGSGCNGNETGNDTTTTVSDNNRLTTLKAEIVAWLIKVDALLALYIIVEDTAVENNSNTGQVNWLSDIRTTTEIKWLGVRLNICEWKNFYIKLSSARVSKAIFCIRSNFKNYVFNYFTIFFHFVWLFSIFIQPTIRMFLADETAEKV